MVRLEQLVVRLELEQKSATGMAQIQVSEIQVNVANAMLCNQNQKFMYCTQKACSDYIKTRLRV